MFPTVGFLSNEIPRTASDKTAEGSVLETASQSRNGNAVSGHNNIVENTSGGMWHSEMMVCDRKKFSAEQQAYLDGLLNKEFSLGQEVEASEKIKWKRDGTQMPPTEKGSAFKVSPGAKGKVVSLAPLRVEWSNGEIFQGMMSRSQLMGGDYTEIPATWWTSQKHRGSCYSFAYGAGDDEWDEEDSACSGVHDEYHKLYGTDALIPNTGANVRKYLYGSSDLSGPDARQNVCKGTCGKKWKAGKYSGLFHNCNTFTSTVLKCAYGFSQRKAALGNFGQQYIEDGDCKC